MNYLHLSTMNEFKHWLPEPLPNVGNNYGNCSNLFNTYYPPRDLPKPNVPSGLMMAGCMPRNPQIWSNDISTYVSRSQIWNDDISSYASSLKRNFEEREPQAQNLEIKSFNSNLPRGNQAWNIKPPFVTYQFQSRPIPDIPQKKQHCSLCLQNGAPKEFYNNHSLKFPDGKVQCPVLRAYKCEHCGATGDSAHTEFYCPFKQWNNQKSSQFKREPLALKLKKTKRDSCGRIRK